MPRPGKTSGAIPGYSGHVPFMRNHLIGRSYTPATIRSAACSQHIRQCDYSSALELAVDSRPQGRDNLYAQVAKSREDAEHIAIVPRVSKRRPPLETHHASGMMDVRQMKTTVGTTKDCVTRTYKTTSLTELPYKDRSLYLHKPREPVESCSPAITTVPGYTGHQHGTQHIFARSYGATGRELIFDDQSPDKATVLELLYYNDPRPVGRILVDKHKMPGYQGYIPAKTNHIYGKTAGKASDLAAKAEKTLQERGNPNSILELVDSPPQGHIDLYAQSMEHYHMPERVPLDIRVNKARVHIDVQERRPDYRLKERIEPDMLEVVQGRHNVHGYTGHVHALQHIYGRSYGKITRDLQGQAAEPKTSEKYLEFTDNRPLMDQAGDLLVS